MSNDGNRKALLLSIAVDTTKAGGGFRAPFHPNGTYEYIPIPEYATKADEKTFKHYIEGKAGETAFGNARGNRLNEPIIDSMPKSRRTKLGRIAIHCDPDFKHITYGDNPANSRGKKVAELDPGDLLVFCPSLENYENSDHGRFVIGYFTVKQAYDFRKNDFEKAYDRTRKEIMEEYKDQNAHFSKAFARGAWNTNSREDVLNEYSKKNDYLVLVVGEKHKSGLFKKAIRLTKRPMSSHAKDYYVMRQEIVRSLGLAKQPHSLHYGRGWKVVHNECIENLLELFRKEGGGFHRTRQGQNRHD